MAINSLNFSAQQILQQVHLAEDAQEMVAKTIAQYANPQDTICDKITWLVYRICNAIKAIFGMSDWQEATLVVHIKYFETLPAGSDTDKTGYQAAQNAAQTLLANLLAAQNERATSVSPLPPPIPSTAPTSSPLALDKAAIDAVLSITPKFDSYKIAKGTPFEGTVLSEMSVRPANLFFDSIGFQSTPIGGGELFACLNPEEVVERIHTPVSNDLTIEFSASGKFGSGLHWVEVNGKVKQQDYPIPDLGEVYGHNTYRMSYQELQDTLKSQKITCSSMLPKPFYIALKAAMLEDNIVILPGHDHGPVLMKNLATPNCKALIDALKTKPAAYGFKTTEEANALLDMSIYQVGAMVVKTEDFRIFTDGNGQIFKRQAGEQDGLCLINACGIRGIKKTPADNALNTKIMASTFSAALQAAESGIVIFPAVGMGVWGGDPTVYWEAFCQAVASSATPIQNIFVNPRHQKTGAGSQYAGKDGSEFAEILQKYIQFYTDNGYPAAVANLQKIVNLYDNPKDVLQLGYNLKKAHPDTKVSIFNASDPDVTLGWHVGEYTNNRPHGSPTTEEHYTMMGTNGICWEFMTGVHQAPDTRIIQAN